jgi:hypothetical protein
MLLYPLLLLSLKLGVAKMENKSLNTSLKMATIMGIFLPLAETLRRANQILDLTKFFK